MIRWLRILLLPFSLVYGMITILRNWLFDIGVFKSTVFDIPVICIGNLAVGGTGKTPFTEYLVELFQDRKIAILSRGYGRKTTGLIIADSSADAAIIGDEPMQYFSKFPQITVAVCEDRVKGINALKAAHDIILLDDAFQHRAVKAGFNILLFKFKSMLSFQMLLPAGDLREGFSGYKRADQIVITKVPGLVPGSLKESIVSRFKSKPVAFASFEYLEPVHWRTKFQLPPKEPQHVVLVSGIADAAPLVSYVSSQFELVSVLDFPDHHSFSKTDLLKIVNQYNASDFDDTIILTTEKDIQRFRSMDSTGILVDLPLYYLPVKFVLEEDQDLQMKKKLKEYVASFKRNS